MIHPWHACFQPPLCKTNALFNIDSLTGSLEEVKLEFGSSPWSSCQAGHLSPSGAMKPVQPLRFSSFKNKSYLWRYNFCRLIADLQPRRVHSNGDKAQKMIRTIQVLRCLCLRWRLDLLHPMNTARHILRTCSQWLKKSLEFVPNSPS